MLTLQSVSKKYGDQQILRDVDFSIGTKEFVSIVGKSGTGKTTLLSILAGLVKPDKGDIFFNGENIAHYTQEQYAHFRLYNIGIVFQDFKIIPSLSVFDNVYMAVHPRRDIAREQKAAMVREIVERVGLARKLENVVDHLSGGEKQRVAIARSLVGKPKLVLADEPTGNLDEKTSESIMRLFHTLHQELDTSFVVITHDRDVARTAQKTYRLTHHHLETL